MNVLIQNRNDLTYLQKDGSWRPKREQALEFASTVSALEYCLLPQLENAQIVLTFGNPKLDMTLPLEKVA